ncbi:dihydroxyacetone kinase subunit DhaK [Halanaerobium sp. Z-7514]|uniref:Dihydroxyacetone kinase subunit DhaK n=1 Tax=Halanaerobium polyolivorans TaxID=2886943 RepID=A0AAW4WXD2_9FIRM|nr:dihydroxyacetone kinase subunit DhaK [Halanaerobium polyolivorans]MCC3144641.1 dihydroxyacetone kinase subunit DhaK [Halanaerobium polyolivorans]
MANPNYEKYLNDPDDLIEEMIDGFVKSHEKKIKQVSKRAVAKKEAPIEGKVGVVSGGGSGHLPAFMGYIGEGCLDSVAVGDIFSSPSVDHIYEAIKAADGGKGVLCCIGNFTGDIMNFEMAAEMAEEEGIEVDTVIINDDVASAPKDKMENRRGVAGEVIIWKLAGAMAERGYSLSEMKELADQALYNTRSMGVAHKPCIMPTNGEPSFELDEGEMEIGVGHHGEPGIRKAEMTTNDEITEELLNIVLEDLPYQEGDEVVVLINGLGATSPLEMYISYRKVYNMLEDKGIDIAKNYIGEFFTSQEMAGYSITLTKVDDELKELFADPCDAVSFKQMQEEI